MAITATIPTGADMVPAGMPDVTIDDNGHHTTDLFNLVLGRDLQLVVRLYQDTVFLSGRVGPVHYEVYDADGNYLSTVAKVPDRGEWPVGSATLQAAVDTACRLYPGYVTGGTE